MARDGILWVLVPLVAGAAAAAYGLWLVAVPLFLLAAFMAYFFRDPHRVSPDDPAVVVSPADGRVTRVEKVSPADDHSPTLVSIFLSPFDVHINRSPIAGEVTDVVYTKGRFRMATREDASIVNEQNALTIRGERVTVVCKQIAGILARRIVCWKHPGQHVALGERIGLIKFSSRTDLLLPPEIEVRVKAGERVRGGVTVVGRVSDGR
ncbi:MAG TPA: phosphatidylserine decarboxylase [Pyrinomonadaceae bacterium]|nr:phosphatidylserine decarboxylase [Pyrinomonadaceae bacterium]